MNNDLISRNEAKHNPCDYCIELECEQNGNVCPLWEKYNNYEEMKGEEE